MNTISLCRIFAVTGVLIFHAGLVFRFRFVRLFPSEWIGYAILGVIFFMIAIGLLFNARSIASDIRIPLPRFIASKGFQFTLISITVLLVIVGLVWRYQVYAGTTIHVKNGDMLPLIKLACSSLLSGDFPYKVYEIPYRQPLLFMPGLWMPYLPFQLFELDIRHLGLLLSAAIMFLLQTLGILKQKNAEILLLAAIVTAAFSLSPAVARFSINGHTYPLWLYISVFSFCIIQGHNKSAAIFFGLMLASRQTSIIYLPLVLIFFWHQGGWRNLVICSVLAGTTCGVVCLTYAILDYQAHDERLNYCCVFAKQGA